MIHLSEEERDLLMKCAIGRLFRLGSRPFQPGDLEQFAMIRSVVLEIAEKCPTDHRPNYARDRNRGAQGD